MRRILMTKCCVELEPCSADALLAECAVKDRIWGIPSRKLIVMSATADPELYKMFQRLPVHEYRCKQAVSKCSKDFHLISIDTICDCENKQNNRM